MDAFTHSSPHLNRGLTKVIVGMDGELYPIEECGM